MKPRTTASPGRFAAWRLCGWLCLLLLSGCARWRPHIDEAIWKAHETPGRSGEAAAGYRVACPDVLALSIDGRVDWQGRQVMIGVDGRVDLGNLGRLRVEGQTPGEIARQLAERLEVAPSAVQVRVAEYRSQKVYIFGQVKGHERALPFRGEETVLGLLQRAGGITPAAAPDDIYVIRARVAEGKQPEVFPVNLRDIVLHHDLKTNLTLEPFDQVYIGETRRSTIGKCIPPIFLPLYEGLCGMYRAGHGALWRRSKEPPRPPESGTTASAPRAPLPHPLTGGD
jgi:protein involved in polysaccharide export with SLBB domain